MLFSLEGVLERSQTRKCVVKGRLRLRLGRSALGARVWAPCACRLLLVMPASSLTTLVIISIMALRALGARVRRLSRFHGERDLVLGEIYLENSNLHLVARVDHLTGVFDELVTEL